MIEAIEDILPMQNNILLQPTGLLSSVERRKNAILFLA